MASVAVLTTELQRLCTDRAMGAGSRVELARLLDVGTADEIRDVLAHLRALDRWHFPHCPKLTDDERDQVHVLIDEYIDEHLGATEDHRRRLHVVAGHLAGEVHDYRLTIADAEARLDSLALKRDADFPIPRPLVPWAEARQIVRDVFTEVLA